MSTAGRETVETLERDGRMNSLRIGRVPARRIVEERGFALETQMPGEQIVVSGLERSSEDGMEHLYRFDHETRTETSIVVKGDDLLGRVRTPENTWIFVPLGDGQTAVIERDSLADEHHHREGHAWMESQVERLRESQGKQTLLDTRRAVVVLEKGGTTIDVLVVYIQAAKARVGNMELFLAQMFANTNRMFRDSGLETRVRAVHAQETAYTESPHGMREDICRLLANGPEEEEIVCTFPPQTTERLDEVHTLRDKYRADLVTLVTYCARQSLVKGEAM